MGNGTPRVSIGMPVYNGEPFLQEALESILKQTYQDWELIISDNASTDATAEIARECARHDGRVRYVRNRTNIGATRNFNRIVELSRGEYFKLANADDLCKPELVARCVQVLDRHPDAVLCYGRTTLIDEKGQVLRPFDDQLDMQQPDAGERFRRVRERVRFVNVLQGLTRAASLRRTGLMGSYVGSDVVLVMELALHGQFYELPERLFARRIHPGAFSSQESMATRLEFVNPGGKAGRSLLLWRHHLEYHRAVLRSPLSLAQKVALTVELARLWVTHRRDLLKEVWEGLAPARRGSSGRRC